MPGGDYEWLKCLWICSNFPEENLAKKFLSDKNSIPKSELFPHVTGHTKTVNVPFFSSVRN